MNKTKIPKTDSIQELAEFWGTHDLTDFGDQLEEIADPVFDRETVMPIHLQSAEVEAVIHIARLRGIDCTDLIREWVLEKIHTA